MMRLPVPGSLRLRFLLAISLWVVLGIAAIWFSAIGIFSRHVEQSYHEELEVHVRELARLTTITEGGAIQLTRPLSDPRYEVPLSGFYWQVTADGHPTLKSESMTRGMLDQTIAHSPEIMHRLENGPTGPAITYGFVDEGPQGEEVHFVIATDQSELDRLIDSFTRDLTVWLVALGALLLATGVALIGFGLHPLDRLSGAIGRLRRGAAQQLEGEYPIEIAPLVGDLNAYIRDNDAMIARARVQAGNLAHSLRTPLAVITDEAERLAEHEGSREAGEVLLAQSQAIEQQIEYQLARVRSASGQPRAARRAVLPDVAAPILRAMERLHPNTQFKLQSDGCHGVSLPVDGVDYSEVLSILLDNAGKWARSAVTLTFSCHGDGSVTARIEDDGPGIPTERIEEAFEVGSRFDPDAPGSGLGLAIARDLSDAMGLMVDLENGEAGLIATVTFRAGSAPRSD